MASGLESSHTGTCMKKRIWKKWMAFVLALIMMAGSMALPVQEPVMAASKYYMKKMPVKWDLKKNKTITYRTKYSGLGMKKQKVKITNWHIEDAEEEGYKLLSFIVTFTRQWKVTDKEIKKYVKAGAYGNYCWGAVVDYKTGQNLEAENDKNVTVTPSDWETVKIKTYRTKNKKYEMFLKDVRITYIIKYPKTYKNLCIGVGGLTSSDWTEAEESYDNGEILFGDTHMCSKKYKDMAHFMRVK